jgi:hypothetical protein
MTERKREIQERKKNARTGKRLKGGKKEVPQMTRDHRQRRKPPQKVNVSGGRY